MAGHRSRPGTRAAIGRPFHPVRGRDGRTTSSGGSAPPRPAGIRWCPEAIPSTRDETHRGHQSRRRRAPNVTTRSAIVEALTRPSDRAAVVGLRQLRDAVQGVRPEGRAARSVREDRRRRAGPPLHRRRPDRRAPHPVGQGRRLRRAGRPRQVVRRRPRDHQLEHVPGRRLHARQRLPPGRRVRKKAVAHLLDCVDIMDATGSRDLKLWFADGTNYPGQDDIRARQDRLAEALATVYARLGPDQRMVLEYKFFEPSFYTTDVPDWGTAFAHCVALGPKALVVLDTGHHAPGTNIEFIVAPAAATREARRLRLQLALLRRRRPDGRGGRSVPAVPDHARGRRRPAR